MGKERKVLWSKTGWASWHNGPREQKEFMLTYQPFIDAIENDDSKGVGEKEKAMFIKDWQERFPGWKLPYPISVGDASNPFNLCEFRVATVKGRFRIQSHGIGPEEIYSEDHEEWF